MRARRGVVRRRRRRNGPRLLRSSTTRGSCRREPRSKLLRREIENWGEIAVGSIMPIAASWCGRPEFEPGSTTNRFAEGAARDQVLAEPLGVLSIGCGRDAPHGWKVARGTNGTLGASTGPPARVVSEFVAVGSVVHVVHAGAEGLPRRESKTVSR